jgi:4-hydroxy-3-methylbut-2-enyl diphosphate reductase IspH
MASQIRPGDTTSDKFPDVNTEETLRPFQEASRRFLQASFAAQQSAIKQHSEAYLDFQNQVREVEREAYRAVIEATQKHVERIGQQATGSMEEMYYARAQSQLDYEKEVRQVYIDTQTKLRAIAERAFGENSEDASKQLADQRQEAYQAYLSELRLAWSNTTTLDPHTMNAIASHILSTINNY